MVVNFVIPNFEKKCLLQAFKFGQDHLPIESYLAHKPLSANDNHGSVILAVMPDSKLKEAEVKKSFHLILKKGVENNVTAKELDNKTAFRKEDYWYRIIRPSYLELEKELGFKRDEALHGIDCLGSFTNNVTVPYFDKKEIATLLIFKDLVEEGFMRHPDYRNGLQLEEFLLGIDALANLHAFGILIRIKQPDKFKKFREIANRLHFRGKFVKLRSHDLLQKYNQTSEFFKYTHVGADHNEVDENSAFLTIAHNDFGSHNFLFKRNEEQKYITIKILDYQMYSVDKSVRDLIFYIFLSLKTDLIETNLNSILKQYFNTFQNTLRKGKYDDPNITEESFHKEIKKDAQKELNHILMQLYIWISDQKETEVDENKPPNEDSVQDIKFINRALKIFQIFQKNKWLKEPNY